MASRDHKSSAPPSIVDNILRRFCTSHLVEEILGDLHERYYLIEEKEGTVEAKRRYWREAIAYLRPAMFITDPSQLTPTNAISPAMLTNYFKIALRNLTRQKAFSFLNLFGLALGIGCSLLIFIWIQSERSVDNFHTNGDQLYQVYMRAYNGDELETSYRTPAPLPTELKQTIPEVEYASGFAKVLRLSQQGDIYEAFQVGDEKHKMKGSRAGTDFFTMFSYPLLHGTPETALSDPKSVAISRSMANLFFSSPEDAFGETMIFHTERGKQEVKVTAIFEDIPSTSSDQFDYLTNWDTWVENDEFKQFWGHFGTLTYVQLQANTNPDLVAEKVADFLTDYVDVPEGMNLRFELDLHPFSERYLYNNFENGQPNGGRIEYVRLLSIVAIFILFIACINFMNLTTARSLRRAKEVGVRKVAGADRRSLIYQFMGEAVLLTLLATLLALLLASVLMPWYNTLTEKQLFLPFANPIFWVGLLGLILTVGLIAGSYPALFLSALLPVRVLKGSLKFSTGNTRFRQGLVVFQFALSALLIIATIVITRQTEFIQNKHLGYDRENVIYLRLEGDLVDNYLTFKEEALRMPGIKHVDRSAQTPHQMGLSGSFVRWPGMNEDNPVSFTPSSVGYDFVKLMGIEVVEGRDFSPEFATDTSSFLVSELAVQQMGLKDPIGSEITIFGKTGPIVGVIRDFHTQSLHQSLRPVVLDVKEGLNFGTILVRTQPGMTKEALASLEEVSQRLNPAYPFTYRFLDDEYHTLYQSEQVVARLSNAFGLLAIFISCLGLLGLAMFAAQQRVKEMSIRKVLGASVSQIFTLFTKDFLQLVGMALLIAIPTAWLAMNEWLQGFAFRINLSWWIFGLAGVFCLGITMLAIGYQAFRTAQVNPTSSLRNE
ncbi:ABC transporter permease [Tunicatimonas pelagia]|uniref:ABC transporter permease n=1 Tax=Tunicatimonas pelagia TaxID=931531 RepID=UPI00266694C3|nr:ABC transporter permease [Tunicatimonas pelagia]WKN43658.1 ABC transporter permease [Tunicatimonas pelagia]